MIKIAIIGNMNNMLYPTAYYMTNKGNECTLFLLNEYSNFISDNYDKRIVVKTIKFEEPVELLKKKKELESILSKFDIIIGTDWAPAICQLANRKLDCFYPAGTDLYDWPLVRWNGLNSLPSLYAIDHLKIKYLQYLGIMNCGLLSFAKNVYLQEMLKKFNHVSNKIILPLPYLINEIKYSDSLSKRDNDTYKEVREQYSGFNFRIVHQSRHMWLSKDILKDGYKGNDILINGFARFLNSEPNACLILFSYGIDVEDSIDLIQKLGIEKNIIWIPRVSQNIVRAIVEDSDIGVGQLGSDWLFYCSSAEILHANIPLICSVSLKSFNFNDVPNSIDYYSIDNESQLEEALLKWKNHLLKTDKNKSWLQLYNIIKPIEQLEQYIKTTTKSKIKHKIFDFYKIKLSLGRYLNLFLLLVKKVNG
jgi:hypothetical protein